MSRSTKDPAEPKPQEEQREVTEKPADPVEIELDTQELRALKPLIRDTDGEHYGDGTATQRELTDTATNLELSQSLDDLRNLSWPLWKQPK